MSKEFKYSETTAPGLNMVKPISWSGMRHMIVEVGFIAIYIVLIANYSHVNIASLIKNKNLCVCSSS